jgi:hypothetical protein
MIPGAKRRRVFFLGSGPRGDEALFPSVADRFDFR